MSRGADGYQLVRASWPLYRLKGLVLGPPRLPVEPEAIATQAWA